MGSSLEKNVRAADCADDHNVGALEALIGGEHAAAHEGEADGGEVSRFSAADHHVRNSLLVITGGCSTTVISWSPP